MTFLANVLLVGRHPFEGGLWSVLGVYRDDAAGLKQAEARCRTGQDFVMRLPFGVDAPEETITAPDCWYPLAE